MHKTVLVLLSLLLLSCAPEEPHAWTRQADVFGSIPATLTVYGPENEALFQGFIEVITRVDKEMSMWDRPYVTDVMRMAEAAGKNPVDISPETMRVLRRAVEISAASQGALDVAIGPLVKAWGIATDHPKVPSDDEIARLLPLTHLDDLVLGDGTAYLKKPGMVVDVGGIAKGFAADQAVAYLRAQGVTSAVVDIGGNVYLVGSKPTSSGIKPWRIGVQDPDQERGTALGVLQLSDTSVVTSGTYERKFVDNGKIYHHILDPATGRPAQSGLVSVTIVGPRSIDCDGFAKVLVLGLDRGWDVLKAQGLEGIFISDDKKVYVTPGLAKDFTLKAEGYEIVER